MDYLFSIVSVVILFNLASTSTDIEQRQSNANSYNGYNNYDKNENYDTPNRYRTSGDANANSNYLSGTGGYYPRTVYDNFNYNKFNEPNSYSSGIGGGNGGDHYGGGGSGGAGGPSNFYAPAVLATPQYNPFLAQQRFNPLLAASPASYGFLQNSPNSVALLQNAVSPYMGNINYALLSSAPMENQNYGYHGLYSSPALYGYGSGGKLGIGDTPTSASQHGIANYGNFLLGNPLVNPFYGIGGLGLINNRQSLTNSDSPYSSAPYHNNYINNANNLVPHVAYGARLSYAPQQQSPQNSQQIANYNAYANLNRGFGNGFAASPLHPYQTLNGGSGGSSAGPHNSYSNSNSYGVESQNTNDNNSYNTDKNYVSSASKSNEKVTSHSNVKSDDRWM